MSCTWLYDHLKLHLLRQSIFVSTGVINQLNITEITQFIYMYMIVANCVQLLAATAVLLSLMKRTANRKICITLFYRALFGLIFSTASSWRHEVINVNVNVLYLIKLSNLYVCDVSQPWWRCLAVPRPQHSRQVKVNGFIIWQRLIKTHARSTNDRQQTRATACTWISNAALLLTLYKLQSWR